MLHARCNNCFDSNCGEMTSDLILVGSRSFDVNLYQTSAYLEMRRSKDDDMASVSKGSVFRSVFLFVYAMC